MSKPNSFGLKLFWNTQVFGFDRLNSLKFTILGLYLMFRLHRISVQAGYTVLYSRSCFVKLLDIPGDHHSVTHR